MDGAIAVDVDGATGVAVPVRATGLDGAGAGTGTSTITVCSVGTTEVGTVDAAVSPDVADTGSNDPGPSDDDVDDAPARSNSPNVAPTASTADIVTALMLPAITAARFRSMAPWCGRNARPTTQGTTHHGKDSVKNSPVRVLVVEDDDAIADPLVRGLERDGYEVVLATTGSDGLARAADVDVVLLDIGLPDIDGLEVLRRLRAASDVPVIVLTARGDEVDRVVGLELGADDYVVKPFGLRELVARIKAVTRRNRTTTPSTTVVGGRLELDRRTRRVALDGVELDLTPKEHDVLAVLAEDPGAVVTRDQLFERAWGHAWYGPTKTLDVHVAALRRKLGDPAWIEAVRAVGFRLRAP